MARVIAGTIASGAAVGALAVGYAWRVELKWFALRTISVPCLPVGSSETLRLLHISDLHITANQPWKSSWVSALADLKPDLVINTGDNLASHSAVPAALSALGPLLDFPGGFVPGSNDWFAPKPKNPGRYLLRDEGKRIHGNPLPWNVLRSAMTDRGWIDFTHRRTTLSLKGLSVEIAGVSDPHHKADHYDRVAGAVTADFGVGLSHSPEPRVLDQFAADGFSMLLSGHTHGGQLRIPGVGALVTNCGLERSRARGLSRWGDDAWLHVSAGLGTSPYTPVRFACRPEATLLTLTPRMS